MEEMNDFKVICNCLWKKYVNWNFNMKEYSYVLNRYFDRKKNFKKIKIVIFDVI